MYFATSFRLQWNDPTYIYLYVRLTHHYRPANKKTTFLDLLAADSAKKLLQSMSSFSMGKTASLPSLSCTTVVLKKFLIIFSFE